MVSGAVLAVVALGALFGSEGRQAGRYFIGVALPCLAALIERASEASEDAFYLLFFAVN